MVVVVVSAGQGGSGRVLFLEARPGEARRVRL